MAPEEEIVAFVDQVKAGRVSVDRIVPFLHYAHPIYMGRSKNATFRLRGWILEAFTYAGLPTSAVAHVLDELESSINPFVVAASAKALRGFESQSSQFAPFLMKAIRNIRLVDDYITFQTYKPRWPLEERTTAVREILITLRWLGWQAKDVIPQLKDLEQDPYFSERNKRQLRETIEHIERSPIREDCCSLKISGARGKSGSVKRQRLSEILVEDQENRIVSYDELFSGSVSVLLLFYTRCENTNRCSRNVTWLGRLQQMIRERTSKLNIRLVALTYDPQYDFSFRSKAYCVNRGLLPDYDCRVGRVINGMDTLLKYLGAGVNYNGSLLNSHCTDLFILDKSGNLVRRIAGFEWDNVKLLDELEAVAAKKNSKSTWGNNISSVVLSSVLVFFPKCPLCAAAYLSMLGITQMEFFALRAWMIPVLIGLLIINLGALFWMARRRKWFLPFYVSSAGAGIAIISAFGPGALVVPAYVWLALLLMGSLLNAIPRETLRKVRLPKLRLYSIGAGANKTTV